MRCIMVKGVVYYRDEDVAEYLRTLGSTEETDVRNRLNEAAAHLVTPANEQNKSQQEKATDDKASQ